ncbi:hypothetical protein GDO81_017465 [Engystomops pustulosus]|uniref:Glucagon / GIP / secretin / VIP family domain-containing protein n=1 Tax=Engystomops pustulosus TaxID=76066 RepID=A0AAV7AP18_ENGPU|nr:hypothetical protein GDO81_017465 [Engystomops pustulosus]
MKSVYYMLGLLFMLLQGSFQNPIQETEGKSRGLSRRNVQSERHAEGSYTNDVTQFLEEKAAKEFIDWLIKGKPNKHFPEISDADDMDRRHADGSFTSDFNKAIDIKAAQEFLDWIINTPVKERDLLDEQ